MATARRLVCRLRLSVFMTGSCAALLSCTGSADPDDVDEVNFPTHREAVVDAGTTSSRSDGGVRTAGVRSTRDASLVDTADSTKPRPEAGTRPSPEHAGLDSSATKTASTSPTDAGLASFDAPDAAIDASVLGPDQESQVTPDPPGWAEEDRRDEVDDVTNAFGGEPYCTLAESVGENGECVWDSDQKYDCICSDGGSSAIYGSNCLLAAHEACARPCSNDAGACVPTASGYDCTCAAYANAKRPVQLFGDCRTALTGCTPKVHAWLPDCTNEEGLCVKTDDGYDCTCVNGDFASFAGDNTADTCTGLLVGHCGGAAVMTYCETEREDAGTILRAECVALLRRPELSYGCSCFAGPASSELSRVGGGGIVEVDDCTLALESCFD